MWNFESMEMGFTIGETEVRLIGLGQIEAKQVGSWSVSKTLKKSNGKGMLLHIRVMEEEGDKELGEWEPWVKKFPTVFGDI